MREGATLLQYLCQPTQEAYLLALVSGEQIGKIPHVTIRKEVFYYAVLINSEKGRELTSKLLPGRHGLTTFEEIEFFIKPLSEDKLRELRLAISGHIGELDISTFLEIAARVF